MNILVIGATGGSGRAVCDALLERGHRVTALARHASSLPGREGLERVDGDATRASVLDGVVPGHDAIVVTLGISEPTLRVRLRGAQGTADDVRSKGTAAIVAAARRAGVSRLVVQSSYGVGDTRALLRLTDRILFALLIRPQIIDSEIQEGVLRGSELDWTIVQPVYLTDGDSAEHFTSTDGSIRRNKVARRGVAQVHAELVESSGRARETVSVSG
ncbi:epimerase [Microbacterium sp. B35-04]|uniref:NAD(P)-dependent oxidoreductase n=1 Tax=unclassified Microbacterium TaxID=2609290 RepID=UPI0013D0AE83|nr:MULTISPECIES: NAD(P)-binding oxidoreductase [unclassified Microbacterium]KAF2414587.1 epimerase [Microbacterium sp. B35-04]KAF2418316.1 epimerase [Microbacterium sp. B35-30]